MLYPPALWPEELDDRTSLSGAFTVTFAGELPGGGDAALLVLILLLVEGARRWFGDAGIYLVSLLAGLTDVDAITLSLASKARDGLAHEVAARGIVFAALSNSLVKAMLIVLIGGRELALRTLPIMFAGLLTGLALLLLR